MFPCVFIKSTSAILNHYFFKKSVIFSHCLLGLEQISKFAFMCFYWQVVLTELSEGAVAYVHHFVLYDICARGFVRPYCLAYVMKNHAELMALYEKLTAMFSLVSRLFHFGNALSFINDLILRLEHLSHLKRVLGEKTYDIFVDDEMLTESQKKSITAQALDDAMYQLHQLVNIFKSYIESSSFSDHRVLFEQRYKEVLH